MSFIIRTHNNSTTKTKLGEDFKFSKFLAFTLVEIIIVIVILAILGLISFIYIQGYAQETRDAKRLNDLSELFNKITLEKINGVEAIDAIKETSTGRIIIGGNPQISHIGNVNFGKIKQADTFFKDPQTGKDYEAAYSNGEFTSKSSKEAYEFIQLRAKSEVNPEKYIIVGKYFQVIEEIDSDSLFDLILDCDEQDIDGYKLSKKENGETDTKEKEIPLESGNGVHKYKQTFKCENGEYKKDGYNEEDLGIICNTSFHLEGNSCVSDTKSCPITNGIGEQTWNGSSRGSCTIVSCNEGHILNQSSNQCELKTYAWSYSDYGTCSVTTPIIGEWGNCSATTPTMGDWGSCSVSCGGGTKTRTCTATSGNQTRTCTANNNGTQTRTATCILTNQGLNQKVDDSYCNNLTKDSLTKTCSSGTSLCGTSGYETSKTCSSGTSLCGTTNYQTSQSCNTQSCYTYSWTRGSRGTCSGLSCTSRGSRGTCSATCGGGTQYRNCAGGTGTQTRSAYCLRSDGTQVSDSYCSSVGTKPTAQSASCSGNPGTQQSTSCNTQACYSRYTGSRGTCSTSCNSRGGRGTCSATCGGGTQYRSCYSRSGTQTRSVYCRNSSGTQVSDSYCSSVGTKPTTSTSCSGSSPANQSTSCNSQSCYSWVRNNKLNGTCSGGGYEYEVQVCKNSSNGNIVANSYCSGTPATKVSSTLCCTSRASNVGGAYNSAGAIPVDKAGFVSRCNRTDLSTGPQLNCAIRDKIIIDNWSTTVRNSAKSLCTSTCRGTTYACSNAP